MATNILKAHKFDEELERINVQLIKQNISSKQLTNEELKLEISSVQAKKEQLELLISEYIDDKKKKKNDNQLKISHPICIFCHLPP
ncbi:2645_t:CDS:2 [Dentiscutata erythropus]|uniref:2645_t:CDS:1 n=1 Tax=Dentiscutata erythropus TaxID=1348616 RepID=A0A9N9AN08_9GLOM|nr:2645_t:CDS:2 [Dentiscutata erythropus]